ncbi:MAG: hypothetical protein IPI68_03375 [Chitinophagaceae bacterium]|nr:hypothetical protein [Chitinophagaceae bacterium]
MNRTKSRYLLLLLFLISFSPLSSSAQKLTGIWKGYFISENGEYYKLEFQISQNGSYGVTGVSYSYLDVRFYGKATMTGSFVKTSASFKIREIKTVEVKSSLGGATCIMNYNFKYAKSGKEEFLEGTYLGKYESKYEKDPPAAWGDCGGGKVFLRKVTTSDFYIEPFLRNKIKTTPVIINKAPEKKDTIKTKVTTTPVKKPVTLSKPPTTKPVLKPASPPVTKIKKDTLENKNVLPPVLKNPPLVIPQPEVLKNRSNELVKTIMVKFPDVTVKLYDNGEIDGDTISVYLDNKLVLSAQRLTATPLIVKLKMDEDNSTHELTMVAENLGSIPPNTSLMIVESGEQRFDVRITSTEQKNAVVRFKYQKPK